MVPADVVVVFIRFAVSSVTELPTAVTAIRAVHRSWNVYVFKTAAKLFFSLPYDLKLVCRDINYVPHLESVDRILLAAQREMPFTWDERNNLPDFIQVVTAQLILQHLLVQTIFLHEFYMSELIDVFVCVVGGVLDHSHPFVQEAVMETLNINVPYEDFLEINITDDIPRLQLVWRETHSGPFCLGAIVECLYRYYIWRLLGMPV